MSGAGEVLVGLVMVAGLVGVVVPVLPGLLLVWAAGLAWALLDGGGALRWSVVVVQTLLLALALVAKLALPARSATDHGAPRSTLLLAAAGAVVGFFVIPVVGLVVGAVVAVFLSEFARLGQAAGAWRSTRAVLVAIGVGVLVELGVGSLMVAVWLAAVIAT